MHVTDNTNKAQANPFKLGGRTTLKIDDIGHDGAGVGRCEGRPIFVPGAVPGDTVEVELTQVRPRFARARLVSLLSPAPQRVEPLCPDFGACGGCQLQQWSYQAQLNWKQERVAQTMARIGGLHVPVNPILPAQSEWEYRNKAHFSVTQADRRPTLSFYRESSHDPVSLQAGCRLVHPLISKAVKRITPLLPELGTVYNEKTKQGLLRHVVMRAGFNRPGLLVTFICTQDCSAAVSAVMPQLLAALPELTGVTLNINRGQGTGIWGKHNVVVWGTPYIEEIIPAPGEDLLFRISGPSFFQVNPLQAARLFAVAAEYAQAAEAALVLDAYCGTGSIALYLSRCGAQRVVGIDEEDAAIADARTNARLNRINKVSFYHGRVEQVAQGIIEQGRPPSVLVVDPPRAGCAAKFLETAASWQPQRIVYVSCNPATLARDARLMSDLGYRLEKLQPVDMFPHTSHVETVALITRVDK